MLCMILKLCLPRAAVAALGRGAVPDTGKNA